MTMTLVNHMFLEPADILAVRLECKQCQATLSFPLVSWAAPSSLACPNQACGAILIPASMKGSDEQQALTWLSTALKKLRINNANFQFNLQFEFDQPS